MDRTPYYHEQRELCSGGGLLSSALSAIAVFSAISSMYALITVGMLVQTQLGSRVFARVMLLGSVGTSRMSALLVLERGVLQRPL